MAVLRKRCLLKKHYKTSIKNCESIKPKTNYGTIHNAIETLKKEIALVKVGDDSYDQTFEQVSSSPHIVKLTSVFSNLKSSKESIYEFGLGDINPKNISINTSGKYVMVQLSTKHLEKNYQDLSRWRHKKLCL